MQYAFALQRLAYAMAEREGWKNAQQPGYPNGSRSFHNNNPLNLRKSPFTSNIIDGFCVFQTEIEGWAACLYDLRQKCIGNTSTGLTGDSTLHDLIFIWAPASDGNDPQLYLNDVCHLTGFLPSITLKELI